MRQDAWISEHDRFLAETILEYIREGKSQLEAFETVGRELNRTTAATGFRWNSAIRKAYEKEIKEAKEIRRSNKGKRSTHSQRQVIETRNVETTTYRTELTYDQVIGYLREQINARRRVRELEGLLMKKERELNTYREENHRLKTQINKFQQDTDQSRDDYKVLIEIMDRARRMTLEDQLA